MPSALARLVGIPVSPSTDPLGELRMQLDKLGALLRSYEKTNHTNKRRQLTALHLRMRELADTLGQPDDSRQGSVADWLERAFGNGVSTPLRARERALRVLEEAVELAQVEGVTPAEIARLQAYVYDRPVGDPMQEIGGVRLALLAYAVEKGLSADRAELAELAHVFAKPLQAVRDRSREMHAAGVSYYGN